MLKHDITFAGIDGDPITETWYFNLSEDEVIEQTLLEGDKDTYVEQLRAIIASGDPKKIIGTFKQFLMDSVGKRSEDGRKFLKTQAIKEEFASCGAYHALLRQMITDSGLAVKFTNNVFPQVKGEAVESNTETGRVPLWIQENREPTNAELSKMDRSELLATFAAREARHKTQ